MEWLREGSAATISRIFPVIPRSAPCAEIKRRKKNGAEGFSQHPVRLVRFGRRCFGLRFHVYAGRAENDDDHSDKEELGITKEAQAQTEQAAGITNIALFGVDARSYDGTFSGRSDAIMVLTIDNEHGKIKLTSILRDVRVYIGEECAYDSGYDKLNHAYAYGGPELAIKTINQNFGLNIEDYVTVNFAAMAEIVDAFGGVDIEVTDGEISELNANLTSLAAESPNPCPAKPFRTTGSAGLAHLTAIRRSPTGASGISATITGASSASRRFFPRCSASSVPFLSSNIRA